MTSAGEAGTTAGSWATAIGKTTPKGPQLDSAGKHGGADRSIHSYLSKKTLKI